MITRELLITALSIFLLSGQLVNAQSTVFGPEKLIFEPDFGAVHVDAQVSDIDGDGDLDVVLLGGGLMWFENRGMGNFSGIPHEIGSEGGHGQLIVSDFTSDGFVDVFSGRRFFKAIDGRGTFENHRELVIGYGVAADVENDGDLDLIYMRDDLDAVGWYRNTDGNLTFSEFQVISTAVAGINRVYSADIDGDGYADVITASGADDKIAWHRNQSGEPGSLSVFGTQKVITISADGAIDVIAVDIDGDADMDVIAASELDDTIAWYENLDGLGTFSPAHYVSETANSVRLVRAADFDNDGDTDLVAGLYWDEAFSWYENLDGLGTFGPPNVVGQGDNPTTTLFVGDLDGDGDIDVGGSFATNDPNDRIVWFENCFTGCIPVSTEPQYEPDQVNFSLANYPNPFSVSTTISYTIDQPGHVSLRIFDLLGRELETVDNGFRVPGSYEVSVTSEQLPTGILFYRLDSGDLSVVRQMVHLK
jgi:FG-GAP-like repeat